MKVGILGSGQVAQTLGTGFLAHGHEVTLGTRDASKLEEWAAQNPGGRVGSFSDAASFGEVVVLAAKGSAAADVLRAADPANLAGKPVLDTTNPIADAPPANGVLSFFTDLDDSLMERLQREFPDARFVKAFNSVGSARMVNPDFAGRPADDVHLRQRRAGQGDGDRDPRPVRLGRGGHGHGRGRPRDRAPLHPLVHPGLPPQRVDARLRAAALGARRVRGPNGRGSAPHELIYRASAGEHSYGPAFEPHGESVPLPGGEGVRRLVGGVPQEH